MFVYLWSFFFFFFFCPSHPGPGQRVPREIFRPVHIPSHKTIRSSRLTRLPGDSPNKEIKPQIRSRLHNQWIKQKKSSRLQKHQNRVIFHDSTSHPPYLQKDLSRKNSEASNTLKGYPSWVYHRFRESPIHFTLWKKVWVFACASDSLWFTLHVFEELKRWTSRWDRNVMGHLVSRVIGAGIAFIYSYT